MDCPRGQKGAAGKNGKKLQLYCFISIPARIEFEIMLVADIFTIAFQEYMTGI